MPTHLTLQPVTLKVCSYTFTCTFWTLSWAQGLALGREQGRRLASLGGGEGTPITVMAVSVARTRRQFGAIISYAEGQEDFIESL